MAHTDYHLITHWRVRATVDEVKAILSDTASLPRWWPAVYLEVRQLADGDSRGVGKRIWLYTKGWLPYTLRWQFVVTDVTPTSLTLVAEGDFVGRGIWTFIEDGDWTKITYDWKIEATKPLLRRLAFLLKPLFSMNHAWAMRQGETSLALEILRRRLPNDDTHIPAPPAATPSQPLRWLLYVLRQPHS